MFLEELPLRDALKGVGNMEKPTLANWAKMPAAAEAMHGTSEGAKPPGFSILGGSYLENEAKPSELEFSGNQAWTIKRSIGSDVAERYCEFWLCFQASAKNGYMFKLFDTTTTTITVTIYKVEAGVEKELGKLTAFTPEAGDEYGIWKVGKQLEFWRRAKGAGAWTKLGSFADTGTEYTKGFFGLAGSGSDPFFTELKGAVEAVATKVPINPSAGQSSGTMSLAAKTVVPIEHPSFEDFEYSHEGLTYEQVEALFLTYEEAEGSTGARGQARASMSLGTRISLTLSSAGTSTAALKVTTGAPITATAEGKSTSTLALTAQTRLTLSASEGVSASQLSLHAPTQVRLSEAVGSSSDSIALTAPTSIALGPSSGQSGASLILTAPTLVPLSTSTGSSAAALALLTIAPLVLEAGGTSGSALTLSTTAFLVLEAAAASGATLSLTALTELPLSASAALSGASIAVTTGAPISAEAGGSSGASLGLRTIAPISATAGGESTATIALTTGASLALAASGAGSATLGLTAATTLPLSTSAGLSGATIALTSGGVAIALESEGSSSATLGLHANALLGLSSAGSSGASMELEAIAKVRLTLESEGSSSAMLVLGTHAAISCSSAGAGSGTLGITTTSLMGELSSSGQSDATLRVRVPVRLTAATMTSVIKAPLLADSTSRAEFGELTLTYGVGSSEEPAALDGLTTADAIASDAENASAGGSTEPAGIAASGTSDSLESETKLATLSSRVSAANFKGR